jgi:hypothetical protein
MGLFLSAFIIGGLPDPLACVAFRASGPDPGGDDLQDLLRDVGLLSRRVGSPTALYNHDKLGQVVLALGPVSFHSQSGIHGREYLTVGEAQLDPGEVEDRRTLVRLVHQGLRDYMASRTDFFAVGQNAYANVRPASEEDGVTVHRRLSFRVDFPRPLVVAVDVGQLVVRQDNLSDAPVEGDPSGTTAVLSTPDGTWLTVVERLVEEVTAGDPVVVGPGGQRETLIEHYERIGQRSTADVVDGAEPVVYLRRYMHGRPGREEPHAASLVRPLVPWGESTPFDPPPSARWKIVQGMANQLGRAHLGAHALAIDVESPWEGADQGNVEVAPEVLRDSRRLEPKEESIGRWDAERRVALKSAGVAPGAPRLGPAVLAYSDRVPQGAAKTLYSDTRYNLFRYLGTKADPKPVRSMEFAKLAELGALLTTVSPPPSAVLVVADDPFEGYQQAKGAVPSAAVQSMASSTLASRPVHGGEDGDAGYFNAVLWLATALEREAGRLPWSLETGLEADAYLGLSLMGRSLDPGGKEVGRGLVTAVDARAGGALSLGGLVPLTRGMFEVSKLHDSIAQALRPHVEREGPPTSLVIHREGMLPRPERDSIDTILHELAEEGLVAPEPSVRFVELSIDHPYRIFQSGQTGPATCKAGSWAVLDDRTTLLATAGYPVKTRGTPEVLMVTVRGDLELNAAVRDVQLLGGLDWGGREIRWPITLWGPRAEMGVNRARPWG